MKTTTTRRTILAGAAALPLLPAAALAVPVALPVPAFATPAESDPILAPFREWQGIRSEHDRANKAYSELERRYGPCCEEACAFEDEFVVPILDRINAAEERISHMVPVTLAGLIAQLTIARVWVGRNDVSFVTGADERMPYSMLAGAEHIAGAAS